MNEQILKLLKKERIGVLAVSLNTGEPHCAVMHFSVDYESKKLFFQTSPTVKTKAIQENGGKTHASVVVGLNDVDFVTLQMRGEIAIVTDKTEIEHIAVTHYRKLPEAEKYRDADTIFLSFTPTWWRYTDFTTEPETIFES
jgi:general stress protein 26